MQTRNAPDRDARVRGYYAPSSPPLQAPSTWYRAICRFHLLENETEIDMNEINFHRINNETDRGRVLGGNNSSAPARGSPKVQPSSMDDGWKLEGGREIVGVTEWSEGDRLVDRSQLTESGIGVLSLDTLSPVLAEVHESRERTLGAALFFGCLMGRTREVRIGST